jgi:hypothetical protein
MSMLIAVIVLTLAIAASVYWRWRRIIARSRQRPSVPAWC